MKIILGKKIENDDKDFYIEGYKYPKDMKQVGDSLTVIQDGEIRYLIIEVVIIRNGTITFGVKNNRKCWEYI